MGKSKDISYADKAREVMNRYKRRLGDDFSKKDKLAEESMNRELELLKQEQESVRGEMFSNEEGLPMGSGGIDLTKVKPGIGVLLNEESTVPYNLMYPPIQPPPTNIDAVTVSAKRPTKNVVANVGQTSAPVKRIYEPLPVLTSKTDFRIPNELPKPDFNLLENNSKTIQPYSNSGDRPYSTSLSPLGILPSLIGYGLNRRAIRDIKNNKYTPSTISPERISLAGERSAFQARGRERSNMLKRMGYSLSPSQRYARTLAGITESDRLTGEEINRSYTNEANTNAEFSQRAKEFNAQEISRAKMYGLDNRNRIAQMRLANNQGLVSGLSGYMRDVMMAKQYDKALASSTDNYNLVTPGSYYNRPRSSRILDYLMMNKPYEVKVRNSDILHY